MHNGPRRVTRAEGWTLGVEPLSRVPSLAHGTDTRRVNQRTTSSIFGAARQSLHAPGVWAGARLAVVRRTL